MSRVHKNYSKAEMITWCPDCESVQGVVEDRFNHRAEMARWRLVKHRNWQTGRDCTNSRAVVSELVIFPNEKLHSKFEKVAP